MCLQDGMGVFVVELLELFEMLMNVYIVNQEVNYIINRYFDVNK